MDSRKNFNSTKREHQPIIEDQSHCCLCGGALEFKHTVDYETLQVREEAECPACMIKLKTKEYGLQ